MIRDQKNLFQFQALHNALINRARLQQRPTGIIGEFDDLLHRGDWVTCLEHGRTIKKEKAMLTARKIILSVAIILSTAFALTTSAAFANAPGGAYIQCDGSKSSPVRCVPDGW